MKRTIIILAMLALGSISYAQATDQSTADQGYASNDGQNRNGKAFFTFDNARDPKEISTLGTNPEFPFLAHMSTKQQVYRAMKNHKDDSRLNNILMAVGFSNGVQDVTADNITAATLADGTTGNMGAGSGRTGYYKLVGSNGFKAWKVTADDGEYVYFLQACGNEFYPNSGKPAGTACINDPVNITTSSPTTITANGQQRQITNKVFVYYHIRKHHKHMVDYSNAELTDRNASRPLLLSTTMKEELVPQTYNVTVSAQDGNVTVCPDSTINVAANINVEKVSTFAGYYPDKTNDQYKLVSRHIYMKTERKIRKAERKEEKIARLTKSKVKVTEEAPGSNS